MPACSSARLLSPRDRGGSVRMRSSDALVSRGGRNSEALNSPGSPPPPKSTCKLSPGRSSPQLSTSPVACGVNAVPAVGSVASSTCGATSASSPGPGCRGRTRPAGTNTCARGASPNGPRVGGVSDVARSRRDGRSPGAPTSSVLGRREAIHSPTPLQRRRSGQKATLTQSFRSSQTKIGKGVTPSSASGSSGHRQRYTCPDTLAHKAAACLSRETLRRNPVLEKEAAEYAQWMGTSVLWPPEEQHELQDELHDKQLRETSILGDSEIDAASSIKMVDTGSVSRMSIDNELVKLRHEKEDLEKKLAQADAEVRLLHVTVESSQATINKLRGSNADYQAQLQSAQAMLEESQMQTKKSEERAQQLQHRRLVEAEKENLAGCLHSNRSTRGFSEFDRQTEVVNTQKRELSRLERQLQAERICAGICTPSEFMKISRRLDPDGLMHENSEMQHQIAGLKIHVEQIQWHNEVLQKYLPWEAQEIVERELSAAPLPTLAVREAATLMRLA